MNSRARAVVLACALFACATPARAAVRVLVAIGNDVGLADEATLRWAEADAARVRDVFIEVGGVARARAHLVQGGTPADVDRALLVARGEIEEIRRRGERAELILTYSGHGSRDALHLAGSTLTMATLNAWLDQVPADATILVVDACRTGRARSGGARGARAAPAFDVTLVEEPGPTGRVVIAAASDGEVAQESDDLEGAFFTHHVLAGLRGAADDDGDGKVTLAELYGYAHRLTLSGSFAGGAVQHPEMTLHLAGQGELVLSRPRDAIGVVELGAALDGAFLVVDARSGDVLFEVQKARGRALRLAAPLGRLRVQRRVGSKRGLVEIDVGRGGVAIIEDVELVEGARVAARTRGVDEDQTPWSVAAGFAATTATTVEGAFLGFVLRGERRVSATPFFVDATALVLRARGGDDVRTIDESAALVLVGGAAEWWTPVGRFVGGAGIGGHAVAQETGRKDQARLLAAGLAVPETSGASLGPAIGARGGLWIPIAGPVAVEAHALGGMTGLVVDGAPQPRFWGALTCGVGVEL